MIFHIGVHDHITAEKIEEAMHLLGDVKLWTRPDGSVIGVPNGVSLQHYTSEAMGMEPAWCTGEKA